MQAIMFLLKLAHSIVCQFVSLSSPQHKFPWMSFYKFVNSNLSRKFSENITEIRHGFKDHWLLTMLCIK